MRKDALCFLLRLLAAQLVSMTAIAQQTAETAGLSPSLERARIETQRGLAQSLYSSQEVACYQKFGVNDCLQQARIIRRDVLADLRRQEVSLNAAEAKRKGAEQISRIEEKSSLQSLKEEADRIEAARQEQRERQRNFEEKAAARAAKVDEEPAHVKEAAERLQRAAQSQAERDDKAQSAAADKKKYDEKQLEAQQRNADRSKRAREQKRPPGKPLPVPP